MVNKWTLNKIIIIINNFHTDTLLCFILFIDIDGNIPYNFSPFTISTFLFIISVDSPVDEWRFDRTVCSIIEKASRIDRHSLAIIFFRALDQ